MKNLLFLTIATMLILGACKRDNSISNLPDVYHYLTLSQIQKTPYFINPDFDTLTFVSNKNDTLIFAKIKTDTSYYKTYERWCFDCRTQTNYHQTLRNTYQTLKGNGKFEVRHSANEHHDGRSLTDLITYSFNNLNLKIRSVRIGSASSVSFLDSVTFNNRTFYNTILSFHELSDSSTGIGYVNVDYGFFHINNKKINTEFNLIKP